MKKVFNIIGISFLILIFFFLPFKDALQVSIILLSIYLIIKIFSYLLKKILWKIRNKLILSYFFTAIIPIVLFAFLSYFVASFLFGEYGNFIYTNNLKNRLNFLKRVVNLNREETAKRLNIIKIQEKKTLKGFRSLLTTRGSKEKKNLSEGMLVYNKDTEKPSLFLYYYNGKELYLWEISEETLKYLWETTLWESTFLIKDMNVKGEKLDISDPKELKTILELKTPKRKIEEESKIEKLFKFKWITLIKIVNLNRFEINPGVLYIIFDSKLAKEKFKTTILSGTFSEPQKVFFFLALLVTFVFFILYLLSFILGIILAKSITSSISSLYLGTKKLIEKNFKYRISKIPSDQLGEVAISFNKMAESMEKLLEEEKEKERLKREIELAIKMQKKLLPSDELIVKNFIFSGLSITAQEVGGDYYDYFPVGKNRVFFSIADVAGKGMPAAFYMAEIKGIIRSLAHSTKNLTKIVEEINFTVFHSIEKISFVTAIVGYLDLTKNEIHYIRCGHPLPIKISSDGRTEEIQSEGIALGLRENIKGFLEETIVKLEPEETLVLYTDGLSEMKDETGNLYGAERIVSLLKGVELSSVSEYKKIIKEGVYSFIGKNYIEDDITILLIRNRNGEKVKKI